MNALITWISLSDLKYFIRNRKSIMYSSVLNALKGTDVKFEKILLVFDVGNKKEIEQEIDNNNIFIDPLFRGDIINLAYYIQENKLMNFKTKNKKFEDRSDILYKGIIVQYILELSLYLKDNLYLLNEEIESSDIITVNLNWSKERETNKIIKKHKTYQQVINDYSIDVLNLDYNRKLKDVIFDFDQHLKSKEYDIKKVFYYLDYKADYNSFVHSTHINYEMMNIETPNIYRSKTFKGLFYTINRTIDNKYKLNDSRSSNIDILLKYFPIPANTSKIPPLYLANFHRIPPAFSEIITKDEKLIRIIRDCNIASQTNEAILLLGESGTGKELFAKGIHNASNRVGKKFEAINCASIPKNMLESELFGHEKGAFTDAKVEKKGIFEIVEDGTIFLDEIGEMPMDLQPKLLRVLETKEFRRNGSTRIIKFKARVVCATNSNILENIRINKFRSDLYYRINTYTFNLPPLKERGEKEIQVLIDHFLKKFRYKSNEYEYKVIEMHTKANDLLVKYSWPGNIRQLVHTIKRAYYLAIQNDSDINEEVIRETLENIYDKSEEITDNNVNKELFKPVDETYKDLYKVNILNNFSMYDFFENIDKDFVEEALKKSKTKAGAGRLLGYSKATIGNKIEKYGIQTDK